METVADWEVRSLIWDFSETRLVAVTVVVWMSAAARLTTEREVVWMSEAVREEIEAVWAVIEVV